MHDDFPSTLGPATDAILVRGFASSQAIFLRVFAALNAYAAVTRKSLSRRGQLAYSLLGFPDASREVWLLAK